MAKIKAVRSREILDSRGIPTVETTIWSDNGQAVASIPAGTSIGKNEALELRDGDPERFKGMGVLKAINNVNTVIAPKVIGMDPTLQTPIDKLLVEMDGTANKSKLGANAILSVSQAVCELGAQVCGRQTYEYIAEKYGLAQGAPKSLPGPIFNLINGGKHGAGNNLDFQEFHVIPSTNLTFSKALETGEEVYMNLKQSLIKRNAVYSVGDEGGFAPNLYSNADALELLIEAINSSSLVLGRDVFVGLDAAADSFFSGGKYQLKDKPQAQTSDEMVAFYGDLHTNYKLFSLEDGLQEDDSKGWAKLVSDLGKEMLIIGDDYLVTNKQRLAKAVADKTVNAILVKPNQIGTISEAIEVVKIAKASQLSVIVSHRSGETMDDFIADFAVGVDSNYVKFGAPARGERVSKYNRLLAIEDYLKLLRGETKTV